MNSDEKLELSCETLAIRMPVPSLRPSISPIKSDYRPQTPMQYCRVYARLQSDVRKVSEVGLFLRRLSVDSPPKCGLVIVIGQLVNLENGHEKRNR